MLNIDKYSTEKNDWSKLIQKTRSDKYFETEFGNAKEQKAKKNTTTSVADSRSCFIACLKGCPVRENLPRHVGSTLRPRAPPIPPRR